MTHNRQSRGSELAESNQSMSEPIQPNVLWICSDQQRFDTLGCYGNPFVRSPNLDRLAQNGVLFEHCYC